MNEISNFIEEVLGQGTGQPMARYMDAFVNGYKDAFESKKVGKEIEKYDRKENEGLSDKGYKDGWNKAIGVWEKTGGSLKEWDTEG